MEIFTLSSVHAIRRRVSANWASLKETDFRYNNSSPASTVELRWTIASSSRRLHIWSLSRLIDVALSNLDRWFSPIILLWNVFRIAISTHRSRTRSILNKVSLLRLEMIRKYFVFTKLSSSCVLSIFICDLCYIVSNEERGTRNKRR